MSIFKGTDAIINRSLFGMGSGKYQRVGSLRLLLQSNLDRLDAAALVRSLYQHMLARCQNESGNFSRRASSENWRFTLNTRISTRNTSREKQVEKRIARLAQEGQLSRNEWANQVPVASGLLDHKADEKACLDLVQQTGSGRFDFIELKMSTGSGHALFAALEVLRYGVVYLLSRRSARDLGYVVGGPGLLGAERVRLVVLAPAEYYRGASQELLQSLCSALNAGLAAECPREGLSGLRMEIDFEQFADSFEWPCSDDELIRAVLGRRRVLADPSQASRS